MTYTYLLLTEEVYTEQSVLTVHQGKVGDVVEAGLVGALAGAGWMGRCDGHQGREVASCVGQSNWALPAETGLPQ